MVEALRYFFKGLQLFYELTQENTNDMLPHFLLQCKIHKLLGNAERVLIYRFYFWLLQYRSEQIKVQTNKCVSRFKVFCLYLGLIMVERQSVIKCNQNKEESRVCLPCTWCYMKGRPTHGLYRQHQRKHWICLDSSNLFYTLRKFRKTRRSNWEMFSKTFLIHLN